MAFDKINYQYNTRVQYKDVDSMGIVHHARYYEFFEAARCEMLRKLGMSIATMEARDYYLPVVESNCKYIDPAKFEEKIGVFCTIEDYPKAKLNINYVIEGLDKKRVIAEGSTQHAFISEKGVVRRAPEFFLDLLR